jgi:methyl-accepting chemotaxis protein
MTSFSDGPGEPPARLGLLGKRRDFLVSRRFQLRAGLLTVAAVLVLLVFLNLSLYWASTTSTERILEEAPELEEALRSRDKLQLSLVLLASVVFLAGVFVVSILETHRTAGAEISLVRGLEGVAEGRYATRASLRRGDNLGEIARAFNEMTQALEQRARHEAQALEDLASRVERLAGDPETRPLAEQLRELARRRRREVGPGEDDR